ncbi:MAG: DNA polymerase III subunit gamma/tau, partial [Eubacteriales bacterium]|nr:DNA polymerase III subunit gamma/tau [Eubacteriales bacterium]
MYQALYRKWRPQTFDQVIGQKHITETLKNQVRTGRLSHAYIFIGTRGTGKTTCARILARAVNCEHPVDGNPCGECAACRGIMDGSVLDVVELDAASNNGVDNVRALRDEAVFSPASVRKRVYIIDEVHMLSTPAFNALLKILEEPPEHLMFILATTELQKVPATILSRCQRHSFKRIDSATLADHLQYVAREEHFDMTRDAAELIARLADGGVRDALSLLDQCSAADRIDTEAVYSAMGLAGNRRVAQLLDGILAHDMAGVLKLFNGMWMDGKDPASLLTELSALLRDILMIHAAPKAALELISGGYDAAALRDFAARMTTEELLSAMSTLQTHMAALKDVKNPKTAAELCLVSLCDDTAGDSVPALKARVSRLEEQMKTGVPARYVRAADEVPDEGVPDEDGPAPAEDAETRYSAPDGGEYNAEPQADEPAGLPDDET